MKIIIAFIFCTLSINSFAFSYKPIEKGKELSYKDGENKLVAVFNEKKQEVTSVEINQQKINIEYCDIFEKTDHRFYSLDINKDGYKDYAFNSANGMKNKYFYYFLFNHKTKKYVVSSVMPKLEELTNGAVFGTEFNGPTKIERTFSIKNLEFIERK